MALAANPYDRFRKILECSICLDVYQDPKTLQCAHEFCQCCLEDILVFQDDGSVTITCPLRCEENTVLSNEQTTNDLATPYTIKSMLDTLKKDTTLDTKADGKPLCDMDEDCEKYVSMYCCGIIMCRSCFNNHLKASGRDDPHEKWNLTFSIRENTLRVLCDKHSTRCTHVCEEDDQLICVYCLHRDANHKDHKVETVEEAAQFMRTALRKELQQAQKTEESLLKTVVSVKNAKRSLQEVLERRKNDLVSRSKSLLGPEVARLTELFEGIADTHLEERERDIASMQYCAELMEKMDFELIREKKFVLDMIVGLKSRLLKGVDISLTEGNCDGATPLGNIFTTVVDAISSQSSLNCSWVGPGSSETVISANNDAQYMTCPNYDQAVCEEFSTATLSDSMEDQGAATPSAAAPFAPSSSDISSSSDNPDNVAALPSLIHHVDSSCNVAPEYSEAAGAYDAHFKSNHIKSTGKQTAGCKSDFFNHSVGTANELKLQGNKHFKENQYMEAIGYYTLAISICSPQDPSKPVYYQNRAAANEKLNNWSAVVEDCSVALQLDPMFTKALIRRSRAHEMLGHMREAYEDIQFVYYIEKDNGIDRPETIESARQRTLHVLSNSLAEQQRQRDLPPMLPAQHKLKSFMQTFNYDPFTIPLETIDRDSNYSEILRNLKRGKYGNVMKFCDKEIESQGWHSDRALLLRGLIKYCMNDNTTIFDYYLVLEKPGKKTDALLHLTAQLLIADRLLYVEQEIPTGMNYLETARRMGIEKATVLCREGTAHEHAKRIDEAKRCFAAAISLDRKFLQPRLMMGLLLIKEANANTSPSEKAEKAMLKLVQDFPHSHRSWLQYGIFLSQVAKRYDEALEKLDKAMLLDPNDPEAFSLKASHLYKHYKNVDEAEKLWLKVIKIDKRDGDAYMKLGYLEFTRSRWEKAYTYFQRAVELLARDVSKTSVCYMGLEQINAEKKYYATLQRYKAKTKDCSDSEENDVKSSEL